MTDNLPLIVVVDDNTSLAEQFLRDIDPAAAVVESHDSRSLSSEEFLDALLEADLVLVDYKLDNLSGERPPLPPDGLALLPVLRRYHQRETGRSLAAFALFSQELGGLSELADEARAHVIARVHGFEWAFAKAIGEPGTAADLAVAPLVLAQAAIALREAFKAPIEIDSDDSNLTTLLDVLALDADVPWQSEARRGVLAARPGLGELLGDTSGGEVLRWLLHRCLPYPTFLYDVSSLGARLGVSRAAARELLRGALGDVLEPARYRGVLAGFDGDRWWRAGVESVIADLAGSVTDAAALRAALVERDGALTFVDHPRPVVVLDAAGRPHDVPVDPARTVEVWFDDWPAWAEPARVLRSDAEAELKLYRRVVGRDLPGLAKPSE